MVDENKGAFNYFERPDHMQLSLTADKSSQAIENIKKMDVVLDSDAVSAVVRAHAFHDRGGNVKAKVEV